MFIFFQFVHFSVNFKQQFILLGLLHENTRFSAVMQVILVILFNITYMLSQGMYLFY